jgi:hypothetical protein
VAFPVPWFVEIINGQPDFRVISAEKMVRAVRERLCWICGERLGSYLVFVLGPMCAINRIISEPPSHRECAEFAVQACPFLTLPKLTRDEKPTGPDLVEPAGVGLERNPGACCLWVTKSYRVQRVSNGVLFQVGDPIEVIWYTKGRVATREEILHAIDTGLPALREPAEAEGAESVAELERRYHHVVTTLVPGEREMEDESL